MKKTNIFFMLAIVSVSYGVDTERHFNTHDPQESDEALKLEATARLVEIVQEAGMSKHLEGTGGTIQRFSASEVRSSQFMARQAKAKQGIKHAIGAYVVATCDTIDKKVSLLDQQRKNGEISEKEYAEQRRKLLRRKMQQGVQGRKVTGKR
jgi:hypothetical protein